MSELTAVLPRRRKRRPPNKRERKALFWVLWCALFTCFDVAVGVVSTWVPIKLLDFTMAVAMVAMGRMIWWPTVWNYIKNGYHDE